MGLFDKLFGGDKIGDPRAAETSGGAQPTATPAPSPAPDGPVPARRERTRPGATPPPPAATSSAASSSPASAGSEPVEWTPLPADGENAALLNAIAAIVSADNVDTRTALYAAILGAELYLVSMAPADAAAEGGDDVGTGEITLQEGQQLSLATIRDPEGRTFLPAFTDVERLARSLPERGRYLKINAPAICRMFLQGVGEGIVINPSQPPSGVITRAEAELLATGVIPRLDPSGQLSGEVPQQMRIAIGKPDVAPPESLLAALRDAAAAHGAVREVHVFTASFEDQPSRLMIGLLMDEGMTPEQMHPTFEAIGKAAFDARGDSEAFDMMPLHEGMLDAIRPIEGIVYSRAQEV